MPHFGTLRDFQFSDKADDIRGADLHGVDGNKLGTIEDVVFEHGRGEIRYVVVDTGGWWSHKRFMVPAERIHNFEGGNGYQIDVVKEHVERYFPPYDEKHLENDNDWNNYESNYRQSTREHVWRDDNRNDDRSDRNRGDNLETSGGVMHRDGSNRTITPEAHEMPMSGSGDPNYQADTSPRRISGKFSDGSSAENASWTAGSKFDGAGRGGVSLTPFSDSGDISAEGRPTGEVAPTGGTLFNSEAERDQHHQHDREHHDDQHRGGGMMERAKHAIGSHDGDWKPDAMERDRGQHDDSSMRREEHRTGEHRGGGMMERAKHAIGSHDGDWKPDAMERDRGQHDDSSMRRDEHRTGEHRGGGMMERAKHAIGSHDGDWKPDAMERDRGQHDDSSMRRDAYRADERGYNQQEGGNQTFAERYMGADPSQREQVHVMGGERGEHHIANHAPQVRDQNTQGGGMMGGAHQHGEHTHEARRDDFSMRGVQEGNTIRATEHEHHNRDYQGSDRGERWNRFEELLRRNRVDIESRCRHCEQARDKDAA